MKMRAAMKYFADDLKTNTGRRAFQFFVADGKH